MKIFATAAALTVLGACSPIANPPAVEPWLRDIPAAWPNGDRPQELPENTFVELPVSIFEGAQEQLRAHAFVMLSDDAAEHYHRKDLVCPEKTTLYLLRAVYTNGSTGAYFLNTVGKSLWIAHMSMGESTGMHRSALLGCLPFEPADVYVTVGGAL